MTRLYLITLKKEKTLYLANGNMLPELPKKRIRREADFGLRFRKWIIGKNPEMKTAAFEHKTTRGKDYLPFSEVKDIQIVHGLKIKGKGDLIRVQSGTIGAPDYIWLKGEPAFIVIEYPSGFVLVDVAVFYNESKTSKIRSLTYKRAIEIAELVIPA